MLATDGWSYQHRIPVLRRDPARDRHSRHNGRMLGAANLTIRDDNDYVVLPEHIEFLRLTEHEVLDFESRRCPLGVDAAQFRILVDSLKRALDRDDVRQYDIRLQGSSAHFFSGYHKKMPWERDAIAKEFRRLRKEPVPESVELDAIENRLNTVWPPNLPRPERRPFDSMHRVGIDPYPSDYDIQVSSDEIAARARDRIRELRIEVDEDALQSKAYNFFQKDVIDDVCPLLTRWAVVQSGRLHPRLVSVAVFTGSGPPPKEGKLSAHFKETDWVLT